MLLTNEHFELLANQKGNIHQFTQETKIEIKGNFPEIDYLKSYENFLNLIKV